MNTRIAVFLLLAALVQVHGLPRPGLWDFWKSDPVTETPSTLKEESTTLEEVPTIPVGEIPNDIEELSKIAEKELDAAIEEMINEKSTTPLLPVDQTEVKKVIEELLSRVSGDELVAAIKKVTHEEEAAKQDNEAVTNLPKEVTPTKAAEEINSAQVLEKTPEVTEKIVLPAEETISQELPLEKNNNVDKEQIGKMEKLKSKVVSAKDATVDKVKKIYRLFKFAMDPVGESINRVTDAGKQIANRVTGKVTDTKDTIAEKVSSAKDTISDKIHEVADGVNERVASAKGAVQGVVTSTKDTLSEKMNDVNEQITSAKDKFEDTVTSAKNTASGKMNEAKDAVNERLTSVKDTAQDSVTSVKDSAIEKISGVKDSVTDQFSSLNDQVTSVQDTMQNQLNKGKDLVTDALAGLPNLSDVSNTLSKPKFSLW